MPKKAKGKQALVALLLTIVVEGVILLLLGWGGAAGWIDSERLLGSLLLTVSAASAAGSLYLSLKKWSAVPAALVTGVGAQLILMLAGYLIFGSAAFTEGRWWMPVTGVLASVLAALLAAGPAAKRKTRKKKRR